MKHTRRWSRLDNAANIFPPASMGRDTKVFRFVCELYDEIDPIPLQKALDRTLSHFPHYRSVIKKGLFWYYFEDTKQSAVVREEYKPPCAPLYNTDRKNLLFEVTYFKKRINLEIFHSLSDGTGAMQFLRTMIIYYIADKYAADFNGKPPMPDYDASQFQSGTDSFAKYYSKVKVRRQSRPRAYRLRGERLAENRLGIIGCRCSVNQVLKVAHNNNCTVSELLSALLIEAIHDGMALIDEKRPVALSVPVNLRKYFPSLSSRNFFCVIIVSHDFSKQEGDFLSILKSVKEDFAAQLTDENISRLMNKFSTIEHNLSVKLSPLIIKTPLLRLANWSTELTSTAAFSNVGRIIMPEQLNKYIRLFDVFTSTAKTQVCICSYADNMMISFTSQFINTDMQRFFARRLRQLGIDVEITSNLQDFD